MSDETRAKYMDFFDHRSLSKRHQTRPIAQNVEAFDSCGKTTHATFICARAHTKKHSALETLSCPSSKCFSSTFERSLFHDPLDTLALKGLRTATQEQPAE